MYSSKHLINIFSAGVITFTAALFVLKYSHIYTGYEFIAVPVYLLILFIGLYFSAQIDFNKKKFLNKKLFTFSFMLLVILSAAFIYVFPRIGEINRLTAIQDWLNLLFNGVFPYNSKLTPSSYPALFFIALPFELIGNLGWLEVIGLAIFLFVSLKTFHSSNTQISRIFFLLATPMIYYEFTVRCELFFNVALVILLIYLSSKYLETEKLNLKFFLFAAAFGIVLSTRSIVAVIYVIHLLFLFRNNLAKLIVFSITAGVIFLIILTPFVLWDFEAFINNGPFAIQSQLSYLPIWLVLLFLISSIYIGWSVRDIQEVYFSSGILIFLLVIISYSIKIIEFGFYTAFFEDKIDLSYLIFSLPLLLLSLKEYKVDRYLGKIFEE